MILEFRFSDWSSGSGSLADSGAGGTSGIAAAGDGDEAAEGTSPRPSPQRGEGEEGGLFCFFALTKFFRLTNMFFILVLV